MVAAKPIVGAKIAGYGIGLPKTIITNAEMGGNLEKLGVETPNIGWEESIVSTTGILERRHVDPELGETTASLAIMAGLAALELSGVNPKSITALYLGTSTSGLQVPAAVHEVQAALGLEKCKSEDVGAACSGFMHGMADALGLLALGEKRVMVIGADTVSTITDQRDRNTVPIFADGAGAIILERDDERRAGLLGKAWDNQGDLSHYMTCEHGGKIRMDNPHLARAVARMVIELGRDALEDARMTPDELDWVVMHQPNANIIDMVVKRLAIPKEKFGSTISTLGNSSAATVPLTYSKMREEGKIKDGDNVMFSGVGVGIGGVTLIMRH